MSLLYLLAHRWWLLLLDPRPVHWLGYAVTLLATIGAITLAFLVWDAAWNWLESRRVRQRLGPDDDLVEADHLGYLVGPYRAVSRKGDLVSLRGYLQAKQRARFTAGGGKVA